MLPHNDGFPVVTVGSVVVAFGLMSWCMGMVGLTVVGSKRGGAEAPSVIIVVSLFVGR